MKQLSSLKSSNAIMLTAAVVGITSLVGCGVGEQKADSGSPQVVNQTEIKVVPESKPKTILVQPVTKPKSKIKTNVTVDVKPPPANTLPEPAPIPEPATTKKALSSTPSASTAASATASEVLKPEKAPAPTVIPPADSPPAKNTSSTKPTSSRGLTVRAEVIAISKVPDPKSVPYKNALVFTKYKVLEVKDGKYSQKEILVAKWAMKDKKIQPGARQEVGDVQTLSLKPLSKRPDLESVMRSDDTEEVELQPYFAE